MSGNVLSRNQRRALAALLDSRTIIQAAEACGLTTKTLSRYLADPVFRSKLAERESELIDQAGRTLVSGQLAALQTLYNLMQKGRSESTRRMAAATWMDLCLRWRDLKIEQRISDLEVEVYGKRQR
jgi:hypothetical protein